MSSSNPKFEMRALIIIVPFAAAFLLGCMCICKYKVYLWTLKKDDSESDAGPKVADVKAHPKKSSNSAQDKGPVSADPETGYMRGAESESDSILIGDSGKGANRKSFCT
ncbi:hypothetical protein M758_2G056300 [Ceratodon purpureus]|uniref:Uncharacterized protein n=1 Tax=Ceratodon purpureus TaxID=3225 RepID=A0A8T0ISJ3_CERPU|nr:hypothetical protein KC19_2G057500 [Ceratodon purpureus]KAG0625450.1 hypothetical protein M758_2G056300 [Ceratodon purpureus]